MSSNTAESSVRVGSIIADTYEIVEMLGKGGMGAVWEASHTRLPGKSVAIKVLHASVAEDPEALARFRREAEIACRLGHPNIVEVHDFNKLEDGSPYLILELLEGTSLEGHLRQGALSVEECEVYLRQIAAALQCAHAQGVVHRDLKPQNIFLVPSPSGIGPAIVKVLDFGISKIRGSQTVQTQDSTLLGTPQYMAPEQAVGQHDSVDERTDIFALGAMMYELLSGKPAFGGQNIPEVVYKVVHAKETPLEELIPGIPAEKAAAIHKALQKKQEERFANVAEFVLAFTGTPLAPERPRRQSMPVRGPGSLGGSRGGASDIAQAATVDSRKMEIAQASTVASQQVPVPAGLVENDALAMASTVDSSKLNLSDAMLAETVLPVSETAQVPGPVVAEPRTADPSAKAQGKAKGGAGDVEATAKVSAPVAASATQKLLPAVALLAIGAGAAFFLMRGGEEKAATPTPAAPTPAVPPATDAAMPARIDAVPAPAYDAAAEPTPLTAVADAGAPDASVKTKRPVRPQNTENTKSTNTKSSAALPPEVEAKLAEAKSLLSAGRHKAAIRVARSANRKKASAEGYRIIAKAYCALGDLAAFNSVLRTMPPAKRRAARAACKKLGN